MAFYFCYTDFLFDEGFIGTERTAIYLIVLIVYYDFFTFQHKNKQKVRQRVQ